MGNQNPRLVYLYMIKIVGMSTDWVGQTRKKTYETGDTECCGH